MDDDAHVDHVHIFWFRYQALELYTRVSADKHPHIPSQGEGSGFGRVRYAHGRSRARTHAIVRSPQHVRAVNVAVPARARVSVEGKVALCGSGAASVPAEVLVGVMPLISLVLRIPA